MPVVVVVSAAAAAAFGTLSQGSLHEIASAATTPLEISPSINAVAIMPAPRKPILRSEEETAAAMVIVDGSGYAGWWR